MAGLSSYISHISIGLVKINLQNELGDITSGPLAALVNGTWHPVFFFDPRLCTLHVLVQEVAQPKR